jgi:hypothetical protein
LSCSDAARHAEAEGSRQHWEKNQLADVIRKKRVEVLRTDAPATFPRFLRNYYYLCSQLKHQLLTINHYPLNIMKTSFNLLLIALAALLMSASKPVDGCRCKNIPLYGRVKVVEFSPDFDVKLAEFSPDLKVQLVDIHPDRCGKWQMVDLHPDFTIRFVEFHPDFTIRYVDFHPGLRH